MQTTFDIIVVGAGLTGLSTAYRAQKAGARVLVLERGFTAYEASSRATGYLSLRGETPEESPLAQFAEQIWNGLDYELGYTTEWKGKGRLWAAFNDRQLEHHKEIFESFKKTDVKFEWVDPDRCREIVPALSPGVLGGIYTDRSGHANPQRTSQVFAWAFKDHGGVILENAPVTEVLHRGDRVTGVRAAQGVFHAGRVVLAAAARNAALLEPFGINWPVAAARLEALVTTPLPPLYDVGLICGDEISVRQTHRGNLHANGGPHEWVDGGNPCEPSKPVTPIVRNIARRICEALPIARSAQVLRCWSGIVEFTPDQMTIIENFDSPRGLLAAAAAGHGFGMAPATGVALAELALEGATRAPIDTLRLSRFKDIDRDWIFRKRWNPGEYNT